MVDGKYKNVLTRNQLLIFIEKLSPLPGFEPTTYQVAVYEADDIPMCHRASVLILQLFDTWTSPVLGKHTQILVFKRMVYHLVLIRMHNYALTNFIPK